MGTVGFPDHHAAGALSPQPQVDPSEREVHLPALNSSRSRTCCSPLLYPEHHSRSFGILGVQPQDTGVLRSRSPDLSVRGWTGPYLRRSKS